ncbi:MAG: SDR family NAD(P)-dependent oxidoreductase, partial [Nitrososphaerota archaeon]
MGIKGRVAIVTGSSRGIGKAIAGGLAREGAKVAICARDEDELKETAEELISSSGNEILAVRVDLRKKEDIEAMVRKTVNEF